MTVGQCYGRCRGGFKEARQIPQSVFVTVLHAAPPTVRTVLTTRQRLSLTSCPLSTPEIIITLTFPIFHDFYLSFSPLDLTRQIQVETAHITTGKALTSFLPISLSLASTS